MIIGVYAPKSGMGASTLSRNLAYVASRKSKVLLVELDYFYPSSSLVLGVTDEKRNMETCIADYTEKKETWNLTDYLFNVNNGKSKQTNHLSVLLPLGKKGFEYFPDEPESFVYDLVTQAKDVGFEDVILDMSAMIDTHFTFHALKISDLVLYLFNDSYAVAKTFLHRIQAMTEHEMVNDYLIVTNATRKGIRVDTVYKEIFPEKPLGASLPFDRKQILSERLCKVQMSYSYQKSIKLLINKLAKIERMKQDKGVMIAYAN